jgi:hypothetical protein
LQLRYLTVDYDRGNFSVSQCVWNDGATPQINTILSPSYLTNSTSGSNPSSLPPSSKSKQVSVGTIAGAAIAGVAGVALAGGAAWYFLRRRKAPVPQPVTDNIALTNVGLDVNKGHGDAVWNPHSSPFLADKKLYTEDMVPRSLHHHQDSRELETGGEIHQLPTDDNREGDYMSLASHIESERRAANTAQIDGRSIVYELHGSEPTPSEMDDEWSRRPRSSRLPSRTWTTVSSRSTSPYPRSPF